LIPHGVFKRKRGYKSCEREFLRYVASPSMWRSGVLKSASRNRLSTRTPSFCKSVESVWKSFRPSVSRSVRRMTSLVRAAISSATA